MVYRCRFCRFIFALAVCLYLSLQIVLAGVGAGSVTVYPAPKGAVLNNTYFVRVNHKVTPVYAAKIGAEDPVRRFKAVDDLLHSADYYDTAAFTYFDFSGSIKLNVTVNKNITSAKILPASLNLVPKISGNSISFSLSQPHNLTIEINGEVIRSLHIFANPVEKSRPSLRDTNVIYFGPGIHYVNSMVVGDNKTVYVAGGAIVKSVIGIKESFGVEPSGLRNYPPAFVLLGKNIRFEGRGIVDASLCPTHSRNLIKLQGSNLSLSGVILLNSCSWTVPVRQSVNVLIDNIKILGYQANSDGIDICNSQNVVVNNCFIRTDDDLVVVKTEAGEGEAKHILVKNCVLWNQLANALSLGAELRDNVDDVIFSDCDIIHDYSRAWCLRIFHSDGSSISNVTFENIRLEESHQFISLWIGKEFASFDKNYGHIKNVVFRNINAVGNPLNIDVVGASDTGCIDGVVFKNVRINKQPLLRDHVKNNPFVKGLVVEN